MPPTTTYTLTPPPTATASPTPIIYIVQDGDTLFAIARRYGVSPHLIADYNHLPEPSRLHIGQTLIIPQGITIVTPEMSETDLTATPTASPTPAATAVVTITPPPVMSPSTRMTPLPTYTLEPTPTALQLLEPHTNTATPLP